MASHKPGDGEYIYLPKEVQQPKVTGPEPPLDFSHHFSRVTVAREASTMKRFYRFFQIPGIGNLAGGE